MQIHARDLRERALAGCHCDGRFWCACSRASAQAASPVVRHRFPERRPRRAGPADRYAHRRRDLRQPSNTPV